MAPGADPAGFLTKGGEDAAREFGELLDTAAELPVFHARTLLESADLRSTAGRDRALDEVLPLLAAMADSITRDELIREVADGLDVDPALVTRRMSQAGRPTPRPAPISRPPNGAGQPPRREPAKLAPLSARDKRERMLLAMCVAEPKLGVAYLRRLGPEHFSTDLMVRAQKWLADHLADPMEGLPRQDEELYAAISDIAQRASSEPVGEQALELNFLQLEIARVEREIGVASRGGGDPPVELLKLHAQLGDRLAGRSG